MKKYWHLLIIICSMLYTISFIACILVLLLDVLFQYKIAYIDIDVDCLGLILTTSAFIPCLYITILYLFYSQDVITDYDLEEHLIEK